MGTAAAPVGVVMILTELAEGACTYEELIAVSGLACSTVRRYIKLMRAHKLVRVASYERAGNGTPNKLTFEWAPGKPDARRPGKLTDAERKARQRARDNARNARKLARKLTEIASNEHGGVDERLHITA